LACGALVVLAGCGRLDRLEECRALAATVNPELGRIERSIRPPSPAGYRTASQAYASLAKTLRAPPSAPTHAQHLVAEYADLFAEVVTPLDLYADSLEKKKQREQESALRALERIARRQTSLTKRMEAYCLGR
jgi:hypothetical protein